MSQTPPHPAKLYSLNECAEGGNSLGHCSSNSAVCAIMSMKFITPLGDGVLSSMLLILHVISHVMKLVGSFH